MNMLLYFRKINEVIKKSDDPVLVAIKHENGDWVTFFNKEVVKDFMFGWDTNYPRNTTTHPCITLSGGQQTTHMRNVDCKYHYSGLCQIPTRC